MPVPCGQRCLAYCLMGYEGFSWGKEQEPEHRPSRSCEAAPGHGCTGGRSCEGVRAASVADRLPPRFRRRVFVLRLKLVESQHPAVSIIPSLKHAIQADLAREGSYFHLLRRCHGMLHRVLKRRTCSTCYPVPSSIVSTVLVPESPPKR
jgi:hypothetical protein